MHAELTRRLEGAPVFALTLKRAVEGMEVAAQRLQTVKTDEDTQRAERAAAKRFKQLIDALKPDPAKKTAYDERASAYEHTGAHDKAMADIAEAKKLDPQNADAHQLQ